MKRIFAIVCFLMAICHFSLKAQDPDLKVGVERLESVEAYQHYIGKTVVFYEPVNEEQQRFKLGKIQFGKEYTIENVEGEVFTESYSYESNIKLSFYFKEVDNIKAKPIKVVCYDDVYIKGLGLTSQPTADDFPLYFVDKLNALINRYVGLELINNGEPVEIVNVELIKEPKSYGSGYYVYPGFVYKSRLTGEKSTERVSAALSGSYHSTLSKVEKPADESVRYGETTVIEDKDVTKYSYIDNIIDILIFGTHNKFSFTLKNVSDNSIKVVWNEAVFVDMSGSTSKVMHSGIKYSQREGDQPASVIIRGAKLDDIAAPTANVRYSEILKEWVTDSMYPKTAGLSGQVSLMLPIQIKETINEYIFVFDIEYSYRHPELH